MKNKILARIQKDFEKCPDLIIKEIKLNSKETIYVTYLESVTGSDKVNDYILKNLSSISGRTRKNLKDIQSLLPGPNTVDIQEIDKIEFYITNGFTIVIHNEEVYALETKAEINRGIPEPTSEPTIVGPKDGFTENIQINLGLVKRRIKSHTLKTETVVLGRKTTTMINILYIDDIAEEENIQKIKKVLVLDKRISLISDPTYPPGSGSGSRILPALYSPALHFCRPPQAASLPPQPHAGLRVQHV